MSYWNIISDSTSIKLLLWAISGKKSGVFPPVSCWSILIWMAKKSAQGTSCEQISYLGYHEPMDQILPQPSRYHLSCNDSPVWGISSNPLRHFKLRPKFWDTQTEGVLCKEDYPEKTQINSWFHQMEQFFSASPSSQTSKSVSTSKSV